MVATLPPSRDTAVTGAQAAAASLVTAEELLLHYRDGRYELIDGEVIELPPVDLVHGQLAVRMAGKLDTYVSAQRLGGVFVETGCILRRGPDLVRAPDVCFIEASALPVAGLGRQYFEGAPTLAVEINSTGDRWSEVEAKVQLYLDAGSRAVWIVDPDTRSITIRTGQEPPVVYRSGQTLRGEPALPGFALSLDEVFG